MLVYYFGLVDGSLEKVAAAIAASEEDASGWARLAYRKGESLRAVIDPDPSGPAREVDVVFGDPRGGTRSVIIPIRWTARGVGADVPVMSADLVLLPIGRDLVEVVFRGSYQPPIGGLGRIVDRDVLHRLAEASVKSFIDQLCRAVADAIASDREEDPDRCSTSGTAMDGGVASGLLSSVSKA